MKWTDMQTKNRIIRENQVLRARVAGLEERLRRAEKQLELAKADAIQVERYLHHATAEYDMKAREALELSDMARRRYLQIKAALGGRPEL